MACKKWKKNINEYIDDLMPEVQKAAFESHMANCSDCRREVSELKEVVSLVKTLAQKDLPYDFESKLRRAIETDELRKASAIRRRDYSGFLKWAGAAAAIFLILFGIFTDRLDLDILRTQPQQEQQRIMMEAATEQEEAATDKAQNDANLMTPAPAEAPKPPAADLPGEKDSRLEARAFTADIARIETNAIDLKVDGVNVTVETLRSIAQEYGIEVLDYSCQGITLKVEEEHREILYRELSHLGRIVETGDQIGTNTISIMILYGVE
jgi:hypothetical protein